MLPPRAAVTEKTGREEHLRKDEFLGPSFFDGVNKFPDLTSARLSCKYHTEPLAQAGRFFLIFFKGL